MNADERLLHLVKSHGGKPDKTEYLKAVEEAVQADEQAQRLEAIDRACCQIRLLVRRRDLTAEQRLRSISDILRGIQ